MRKGMTLATFVYICKLHVINIFFIGEKYTFYKQQKYIWRTCFIGLYMAFIILILRQS